MILWTYLMLLIFYFFIRYVVLLNFVLSFFFKQKTAYEMRISDWSSDVCSSDLYPHFARLLNLAEIMLTDSGGVQEEAPALGKPVLVMQIGRASCRERVGQYV